MAKVQLVNGKMVNAPLTDIKHVGDEGARSAMTHTDGRTFPVYNSIADGFNDIWVEQISLEQSRMKIDQETYAREKALYLYISGLERGDTDQMSRVLGQAQTDPVLEKMIVETHEIYTQEMSQGKREKGEIDF